MKVVIGVCDGSVEVFCVVFVFKMVVVFIEVFFRCGFNGEIVNLDMGIGDIDFV